MNDRAKEIHEKARRMLDENQADLERQEWLAEHKKEARFQDRIQRTAPGNGLIYNVYENAMQELEEILTPDQIAGIGEALGEIRGSVARSPRDNLIN